MADIVQEHRTLVRVFETGDLKAMTKALDDHINIQTHAVDFLGLIARRRAEREPVDKT
jgi:GH24 family phage-related lysozyme (muramidase)